jgi:predicted metal-dependent hydrolase
LDLAIAVKRSATRRKLTITVERDRSIVVHAPEETSDEKIQEVLEAKRQWIYGKVHHLQKYQDLPHPPGKELVSGESAYYLGRQYRIELAKSDRKEVRFVNCFLVPVAEKEAQREALRSWYIGKAKEKIMPRVQQHARELGVDVHRVKIVDNRYRWGSCTPRNNVTLNWRLIKAPMFVIGYVIVHELAHLIEANHTPRFWNIVKTHTPQMEKAREWLKQYGQLLEQEI